MEIIKSFLAFFPLLCSFSTFAQKSILDEKAFDLWPTIINEQISNDGKFIFFTVKAHNPTTSSFNLTATLKSVDNTYKKDIPNVAESKFTEDGRFATIKTKENVLMIVNLKTKNEKIYPSILSIKISPSSKFIALQKISGELELINLYSGDVLTYPNVDQYGFNASGGSLFFSQISSDDINPLKLKIIDLKNNNLKTIWKGANYCQLIFDKAEKQIAFFGKKRKEENLSIYYYSTGMDSSVIWLPYSKLTTGFMVDDAETKFSDSGNALFFYIKKDIIQKSPELSNVNVSIWNTKDEYQQTEFSKMQELRSNRNYLSIIRVGESKIIQLNQDGDEIYDLFISNDSKYVIVKKESNLSEAFYRKSATGEYILVNAYDGSRKIIKKNIKYHIQPWFSLDNKYIFWYDIEDRGYLTYNIQTGTISNISSSIAAYITSADGYNLGSIVGWSEDPRFIFISDNYDIWKLDLAGISEPIQITNGYGKKNNTHLRFVYLTDSWFTEPPKKNNQTILISAFDNSNKQNGFFSIGKDSRIDPIKLIMSDNLYYFPRHGSSYLPTANFIKKAKSVGVFLLKRMSATEYPNLLVTTDFKSFSAVSDFQPQKDYNWLTAELFKWRSFDGKAAQGVLYKPADFDSTKKYPVIFHLYRGMSHNLNQYLTPESSTGSLNIPWFVSHGYLVFCPDINVSSGNPGIGAYNYVVSAAEMIAKMSWVDPKRMGIQGHSFGGFEVNSLVTKTNLFAAAASAAGVSNMISNYTLEGFAGCSGPAYTERAAYKMIKTLWEMPESYINNSPVFMADKVQTPLLIMHNRDDMNVPYEQSVEFFTVLRRAGKIAWMLEYGQARHEVYGVQALDYNTRLTQFFDYYLKDKPIPKWMSVDISSPMRGMKANLEFIQ